MTSEHETVADRLTRIEKLLEEISERTTRLEQLGHGAIRHFAQAGSPAAGRLTTKSARRRRAPRRDLRS